MVHEVSAFVPIETRHGDDCTCSSVGQITLDFVAASPACPGDHTPRRPGSVHEQVAAHALPAYPGSVIVTWPGADPKNWQIAFHDAATGEMIHASAFQLALDLDVPGATKAPCTVDLRLLVDHDDQPLIGSYIASLVVRDPDNGKRAKTRDFRCAVAEMRTAPVDPTVPTEASVIRGEHSPNQLREYRGLPTLGIDGDHVVAMGDLVIDDPTGAIAEAAAQGTPVGIHCHAFPFVVDGEATEAGGVCQCGMTWERYQQLLADEAAGIRHWNETARPVDEYGRAVEMPIATTEG